MLEDLYVSWLSAGAGWGNASLCTYLDTLQVEGRELLLAVRTWTLCWWRTWKWFSLYEPGLSAGGGQGNASYSTNLGCLL